VIQVPTDPASTKANSDRFAAGYINYYLRNAGLVMPALGDATVDRAARDALRALCPLRHVVQIRIDSIAAGGGGIHCTRQQQPLTRA
jgi:agmatine deiminase